MIEHADLFPETLESSRLPTLEEIFILIQNRHKKVTRSNEISGVRISPNGSWVVVEYDNGDQRCFAKMSLAIEFMDKNIPK